MPSLEDAQAHLREMKFSLLKIDGQSSRYELINPDGRVWGNFQSVIAFWEMWMTYAGEVLSEGRRATEFVREFEFASANQRAVMVSWHEARLTENNAKPMALWEAQYPDFTPDTLPMDWKQKLIENLNGWVAGRMASRCMVEKMAELDADARSRIKAWPAKIGLPELQIVDCE